MLAIKKKFGKTLLDLVIAIPAAFVYACVLNCFFKLQFAIDSPFCYRFIYICKQPRGNISAGLLHQHFLSSYLYFIFRHNLSCYFYLTVIYLSYPLSLIYICLECDLMSEEKRVRRTPEQIAADLDVQIEKLKDSILELENKKAASATEFDNKIAAVKEKIAKLEAKKKDVLTPKKRKPRKSKADQIKLLVRQAQKSGMKLDEIADKLGMALPE